jgi:hypothetical protein
LVRSLIFNVFRQNCKKKMKNFGFSAPDGPPGPVADTPATEEDRRLARWFAQWRDR